MHAEISIGDSVAGAPFHHEPPVPPSSEFRSRAARRRSASHPIRTALLTARRVLQLQYPFGTSDSVEAHGGTPPLPPFSPPELHTSSSARNLSWIFLDPPVFPPLPKINGEAKADYPPCSEPPPRNPRRKPRAPPPADPRAPARPTRSNCVDLDLVPHAPLPVIISSARKNSHPKNSTHCRRWTTQRAKHFHVRHSSDHEHLNVNLIRPPTTFNSMGPGESHSSHYDVLGSDLEDYVLLEGAVDPGPSSSGPFSPPSDKETRGDDGYLNFPKAFHLPPGDRELEVDMEDLITPTLKSCERFEADPSITPCQTFSTPTFTHHVQRPAVRMTPRMIFEDFHRKYQEEELLIRSRDLETSPRTPSTDGSRRNSHRSRAAVRRPVPGLSATNSTTNSVQSRNITTDQEHCYDTSMESGYGSAASTSVSTSDCSMTDPADESFESFGDEQMSSVPSSVVPGNSHIVRKLRSPLVDSFPPPPVSANLRRMVAPRTPSPKATSETRCTALTEDKPFSRILPYGDGQKQARISSSSPLILGTLLPTRLAPNMTQTPPAGSGMLNRRSADYQRLPSPYRHVQSDGNDHHGPDHLESSTRLMKMFETFLETIPTSNHSSLSSSRSSFSKKSIRKTILQETPLRRLADFRFPEAPKLTTSPSSRGCAKLETFSVTQPLPNISSPQRSSSLCLETSKLKDSPRSRNPVKSVEPCMPNKHTLAALSPDVCRSIAQRPHVSCDKCSSPMSDSDEGTSQSPRTPLGDGYNPPTHVDIFERYAPDLVRLSPEDESYGANISVVKDDTCRLKFQPFGLQVLKEDREKLTSMHFVSTTGWDLYHQPHARNVESSDKPDDCLMGLPRAPLHPMRPTNKIPNLAGKLFISPQPPPSNRGVHNKKNGSQRRLEAACAEEAPSVGEATGCQSLVSSHGSVKDLDGSRCGFPSTRSTGSARNLLDELNLFENQTGTRLADDHSHNNQSNCQVFQGNHTIKGKRHHPSKSETLHRPRFSERLEAYAEEGRISYYPREERGRSRAGCDTSSEAFRRVFHERRAQESQDKKPRDDGTNHRKEGEDLEPTLSPIRLYGKQQGILETGNWKTKDLNFQSMKSQYQVKKSDDKPIHDDGHDRGRHSSSRGSSRSRSSSHSSSSSRNEYETKHDVNSSNVRLNSHGTSEVESTGLRRNIAIERGNVLMDVFLKAEKEEEEEREKKELMIVYRIQQEDDNQILNFELNRLKKKLFSSSGSSRSGSSILKASKSKSKLSMLSSKNFIIKNLL